MGMMPDDPAFGALGMPPPPDERLSPKPMTLSAAVHCVDATGFEEGMTPPLTLPSFPKLQLLPKEERGAKRGRVGLIVI